MAGTLIIETGAWELIASPSNAVSECTRSVLLDLVRETLDKGQSVILRRSGDTPRPLEMKDVPS